ncbi:MAG TPA: glycosyltransferase family 4 protein [Verrucomicrobiota bacterium]|nr:glycosyltransferase family 4 protein [Verrucomicrobiota bacterium]
MRLLFVHDRFGAMGGAEVNIQLTARELRERGHSIALAHGPGTGRGEPAWRKLFPITFPLDSGANALAQALHEFEPESIYVHKLADLAVIGALATGRLPVARMVHDHDLYCLRSYKYFPLTRTICNHGAGLRCIFPCAGMLARNGAGGLPFRWRSYLDKQRELALNRRFRRMIVATEYMKEQLLKNGFRASQIEIHSPVPRDDVSAPRSRFSPRNRIVYAGQIIRGKGVDILLESLARMRPPFECVILGDGSHRAYCERLRDRLGLGSRVHFTGYVPQEEISSYYADASVAAVSSVWPEPFGAVGLEAMRHGVPVVAFDAGGIREWLFEGVNGFLVPWMDRNRFAARIEQLLQDKALARALGERGRQIALEKFGFDQYISGLEQMFQRLCIESAEPVLE